MTLSVISPPSIDALQMVYSITSSARCWEWHSHVEAERAQALNHQGNMGCAAGFRVM
jgi:hypothetical protein